MILWTLSGFSNIEYVAGIHRLKTIFPVPLVGASLIVLWHIPFCIQISNYIQIEPQHLCCYHQLWINSIKENACFFLLNKQTIFTRHMFPFTQFPSSPFSKAMKILKSQTHHIYLKCYNFECKRFVEIWGGERNGKTTEWIPIISLWTVVTRSHTCHFYLACFDRRFHHTVENVCAPKLRAISQWLSPTKA